MLCEELTQDLGFDCSLVEAEELAGFHFTTPVDFADGTPISFYVHPSENFINVSDGGETVFHLLSCGLISDERKTWKGLSRVAEKAGFSLRETGEIELTFPAEQKRHFLPKSLELAYACKSWEEERIGRNLNDLFFVDEVEAALLAWKPNQQISKNPKIYGYSKKPYEFDFGFDGTLIDAIKPSPQSTAHKLRKVLDIQKGPSDTAMLFVIDDRENHEKAEMERDLIGGIAKAMLYSDLKKQAA